MKHFVALALPLALLGCGTTREVMVFDPRTGALVPCSSGSFMADASPSLEARACADQLSRSGYPAAGASPVMAPPLAGPSYNPFRPPAASAFPVGTPVYPLPTLPPDAPGAAQNFGTQSASNGQGGPDSHWYEPDGASMSASEPGPAVPLSPRSGRRGRPTALRPDNDQ